jgi:hypothetical protein
MRQFIAGLVVLTLGGVALSEAQSLGEVAARERERREKQKGEPKVMTETELARARGRGLSVTEEAGSNEPATDEATATTDGSQPAAPKTNTTAAAARPGAPPAKTDDEIRADKEKEWRAKVEQANKEVTTLRDLVTRLESTQGLYTNEAMVKKLNESKQQLAAAEARVEALEDERRHSGYR